MNAAWRDIRGGRGARNGVITRFALALVGARPEPAAAQMEALDVHTTLHAVLIILYKYFN